jgi:hypothetical protein
MIRYIRAKNSRIGDDNYNIKVDICHETQDRIAVEFLSVTYFCWIGYYKWYFKDHFYSVFEFITDSPIN